MTCTESNQKHRVHQQDHHRTRLMEDEEEEDTEDEAEEEASHEEKALVAEVDLAKVGDQSLVTTAEL